MLSRRLFLMGVLASGAAACVQPEPRSEPPVAPLGTDQIAAWSSQATSVLADSLAALRVCDTYAAYRLSASLRRSSDPIWDPPTSTGWAATQQQASGLRQRAEQLFQTIANAQVDASVWRPRRAQAAGARELMDAVDALRAYVDRANHFAPDGDGSGGLDLLKTAWSHWDAAARAWSIDRAEAIGCG